YVTVGSDHTDRKTEASSIELSKLVCPKVLGSRAWLLAEVERHWDELVLRSAVDDDVVYHQEPLGCLLPPRHVLGLVDGMFGSGSGRPGVLFLGAVPLKVRGFRFEPWFGAYLEDPVLGRVLSCDYRVEVIDRR